MRIVERLYCHSRITQMSNGNAETKTVEIPPTSGQKWWASVLLGFLAAVVMSPAALGLVAGLFGVENKHYNIDIRIWLLNLLILILVIRLILW